MFLGAYTQYHFMIYAFYLTVVFDIVCLFQKKYKIFWSVSFGALLGVLFAFALFPVMTNHLFGSYIGKDAIGQLNILKIAFFWQKEFFSIILCHLFGFNLTTANLFCIPLNIAFLMVYVSFILAFILCKFKLISIKSGNINQYLNKTYSFINNCFQKNYQLFTVFIAVYLFVSTIAQTINYKYMNVYSMRYFSAVYPFIAILIIYSFQKLQNLNIFNKYKYKKLILVVLLTLFCFCGQLFNLHFIFKEKEDEFVEAYRTKYTHLFPKSNIIFKSTDVDQIHDFSIFFKDCNKCFIYKESKELINVLNSLDFNENNYLIVPYEFGSSFYNQPFENKGLKFKHIGYIANFWIYNFFEIQKCKIIKP